VPRAAPYDKLAANYLAFIQLASIRLWLLAGAIGFWTAMAVGRQSKATAHRA